MKLILTKIIRKELCISDNLFCKGKYQEFVEGLEAKGWTVKIKQFPKKTKGEVLKNE